MGGVVQSGFALVVVWKRQRLQAFLQA